MQSNTFVRQNTSKYNDFLFTSIKSKSIFKKIGSMGYVNFT